MKKFLIKILILVSVFFLIDKIFLIVRIYSGNNELDNRLEHVMNGELERDIIVFGSSRAARDISASSIARNLNVTCFNLAYPGSDITFHTYLLNKLIEKNKKPKVIILNIDDDVEIGKNTNLKFRKDRLYPMINNPDIREDLVLLGDKNWLLSKLFVLHQLNRSNFDFRKKTFSKLDTLSEDGSMLISFQKKNVKWNDEREPYDKKNEVQSKIDSFKRFQDICLLQGIELVLVKPPLYHSPSKGFQVRMDQLIAKNIICYEADTSHFIGKKDLFFDPTHLKSNGAKLFTEELIKFVKNNSEALKK